MNKLEKYQGVIAQLNDSCGNLLNETAKADFSTKANDFTSMLNASKYIKVPLVGIFSAGKSSLLNVFVQKPSLLPVDTLPETAIAYELYYDINEHIELYRDGNKIDDKSLAQIKEFSSKPGDVAKVYVNSSVVKSLQERNIILVDMPGIGSGIERHDLAIGHYIEQGTAFVLIVSSEQGSLRNSTLLFLEELKQYNLNPAVLISKSDKASDKDLKDMKEYVTAQLSKISATQPYVATVSAVNNDIAGFSQYMNSLDPDKLLAEKVGGVLKNIVNSVVASLKLQAQIKLKNIEGIDEKIKSLDKEIENVKVSLPTSSVLETPEQVCSEVLSNIKDALGIKASDLASMIVKGEDPESIKSAFISVVRAELVKSIKEESEKYADKLSGSVNQAMKDIDSIDLSGILSEYEEMIDAATMVIINFINKIPGFWGKILKVLAPFIGTIIGKVVNWIFGESEETKTNKVVGLIKEKIISEITEGLKPHVLQMVIDNQAKIKDQMQKDVISSLEKSKDALKDKIKDAQKDKSEVESEVAKINGAIDFASNMMNQI